MNYYEKHIGDYIRDTVSLTMLEDGAYNRLLDQHYQTERPLPIDKKEVYRLARAGSTAERKAVDYVLGKFFDLGADGYTQKRAQAVIEAYWDREPAEQEKRENAKIRQQRSRERRKHLFEVLREHGVTPEFNAKTKELEALLSRVTSGDGNASVTRDDTLTQPPTTNPQSPNIQPEDGRHHASSIGGEPHDYAPITEAPLPERQNPEPDDQNPAIVLAVKLRSWGVNATFTHPAVLDWVQREVPLEILKAAVAEAREVKGEAKLAPNYLVPIVERLLNPPPKAEAPKPRSDDWAWKRSNQGIEAKGRELNMFARGGESYADFAARIQTAIDNRKGSAT